MQQIQSLDYDLSSIFGGDKIKKWNKSYPILKSNSVFRWIQDMIQQYCREGKEPSKFNITGYLKNLQDYCDFYEVEEPNELLLEELDNRNTRLSKYLADLLSKGKNEASVKNSIQSNIKSFFSNRGSPITFQLKCLNAGINDKEIILIKNTIRLIEERLTPQYKLIMKIQAQLGFRIEDTIEELSSGKYTIEKYGDHYFIRNFKTQKEGVVINYVFIPTELSLLLKSVNNCTDLTKLDLKDLFQSKFKDSESKIDQSNYLKRIKQILGEIGLEGNLKTHSFRKYFSSRVRESNVDIEFSEHLMGHMGQNLSQSYNNNLKDIQYYYSNWLKVEPNLLINSEIVDKTSDIVIELKKEFAEEKAQKDKIIESQAKDILELKSSLIELQQDFKKYIEFMKLEVIDVNKTLESNQKALKK
jgi:integrase